MYQLVNIKPGQPAAGVLLVADKAFIPEDSMNPAWQEYQAWLAAGNTPLAAIQP